jgi:outer membrane protein assembly factor BamE (lipoprotein component of BamABCDE complex)
VRRNKLGRALSAALIMAPLAGLASLGACTPTIATHGHTLDEAAVARITPGRSSRQEVLQLLGSPSALASFDDAAWYYVSQRTEKTSFYQEELVAQDVIAITFDDQGLVQGFERHGLEQTAAVDPVERTTPTTGTAPSVWAQIIGNIGRFGTGDGSAGDPDS